MNPNKRKCEGCIWHYFPNCGYPGPMVNLVETSNGECKAKKAKTKKRIGRK